jgi:hypothetical protein
MLLSSFDFILPLLLFLTSVIYFLAPRWYNPFKDNSSGGATTLPRIPGPHRPHQLATRYAPHFRPSEEIYYNHKYYD